MKKMEGRNGRKERRNVVGMMKGVRGRSLKEDLEMEFK